MATVHLLSAAPAGPQTPARAFLDLEHLRAAAAVDRRGVHRLVGSPEAADLVLFVEVSQFAGPYFERVRRHEVFRAHRDKSYLFCSTDRFIPFLPGVYASIEWAWHRPSWTRPGHYVNVREDEVLRYVPPSAEPRHLFSFLGSAATHPVRRRVLALRHPRALVVDTQAEAAAGARPEDYRGRYARSVQESAFVLCPRGGGTASFRLFETMMLGRAPVIVSDGWVPPVGPDWESFSVRVAEDAVEEIPALLEARAASARAMGEAARGAWLDWFSPESSFHTVVEACLELHRRGARPRWQYAAPYLQLLRPYHAARWAAWRFDLRRLRRR